MEEWLGDRPSFLHPPAPLPPPVLSPFSFFHSPSHSLLKRLSHWFAFCCGESGEVAQCVLVKALPHLPGIIRQLCWKDPSLIPLWWPISPSTKGSQVFLFFLFFFFLLLPVRISVRLRPASCRLPPPSIDTVATCSGRIFSCQYRLVSYCCG